MTDFQRFVYAHVRMKMMEIRAKCGLEECIKELREDVRALRELVDQRKPVRWLGPGGRVYDEHGKPLQNI